MEAIIIKPRADAEALEITVNSKTDAQLNGRVIVLKRERLETPYREVKFRLWRATGGFGCNPNALGSAVFAQCLYDGELARWERSDVQGWISDEDAALTLGMRVEDLPGYKAPVSTHETK